MHMAFCRMVASCQPASMLQHQFRDARCTNMPERTKTVTGATLPPKDAGCVWLCRLACRTRTFDGNPLRMAHLDIYNDIRIMY